MLVTPQHHMRHRHIQLRWRGYTGVNTEREPLVSPTSCLLVLSSEMHVGEGKVYILGNHTCVCVCECVYGRAVALLRGPSPQFSCFDIAAVMHS